MTMKLVQRRFLKGSRKFEIVDDMILVRVKSLLKEDELTVDLSTLDPEPVIVAGEMAFYSPHKGQPVFSLLLNKPTTKKFNRFIDALKQKITGEYNNMPGVESISAEKVQSALAWNVYEAPTELAEPGERHEAINFKPVIAQRLAADIAMLKTYLNEDDIRPLLDSLEVLQAEPKSEIAFRKVLDVFDQLGITQGAVLTYAPYLKVVLSEASSI